MLRSEGYRCFPGVAREDRVQWCKDPKQRVAVRRLRRRKMVMRRLAARFALTLAVSIVGGAAAWASDFSHECRSADGRYVVSGGALEISDGPGAPRGQSIDYRVVQEHVLKDERGYCVSGDGQRFGFSFTRSVQLLAFTENGAQTEVSVICEVGGSGLPAAYSCDRSVTTSDYETTPTRPAARCTADDAAAQGFRASRWRMGRSRMVLYAKGNDRVLVYEDPDAASAEAGARPGDVAFRGARAGEIYTGEAFVFTSGCGVRAYQVEGRIGPNQTSVAFNGETEVPGAGCRLSPPRAVTFDIALARG
jgi:hypothetical protein